MIQSYKNKFRKSALVCSMFFLKIIYNSDCVCTVKKIWILHFFYILDRLTTVNRSVTTHTESHKHEI